VHRQLEGAPKKSGLKAAVKAEMHVLSQHHHRERLDFAKNHLHWTIEGVHLRQNDTLPVLYGPMLVVFSKVKPLCDDAEKAHAFLPSPQP